MRDGSHDDVIHWYIGSGVLGREANNFKDSWISTGIGGGVGRWAPTGR